MRFGEVTLLEVGGHGPEDVVLDGEGRIYTGVDDGRILRHTADGRGAETIADTGGRPLGLELYGDDELLICDARAGLLVMPLVEAARRGPWRRRRWAWTSCSATTPPWPRTARSTSRTPRAASASTTGATT